MSFADLLETDASNWLRQGSCEAKLYYEQLGYADLSIGEMPMPFSDLSSPRDIQSANCKTTGGCQRSTCEG